MGASPFTDMAYGKDAHEAFHSAVQQALYDHGHAGYTGTIGEKPGFVLIPRPPRVKASDVIEALEQCYGAEALIDKSLPWMENWKRNPRAEKAWQRLVGWYGATTAKRYYEQYNSKWDECVAVECSDAETKAYKERYRIGVSYERNKHGQLVPVKKNVRNFHLFIFAGWASC